jgi:hypothetical protein
LASALDKAADSLTDEALKSHIKSSLQQWAQELHSKLVQLQTAGGAQAAEAADGQLKRPRKRSKPAADSPPKRAEIIDDAAEEEEAALLPPASLLLSAGYRRLAQAAVDTQPDPRHTTAALLLSRRLPDQQLVVALADGPGEEESTQQRVERARGHVAAAAAALGACAALATEAGSAEDALRMFAPAVAQLSAALSLLVDQQNAQQQAGAVEGDTTALLSELARLAARALASMHTALQQQRLAPGAGLPGGRTGAGFWRTKPLPSPAVAAEAARGACAALCMLRARLRMHGEGPSPASKLQQRRQLDAQGLLVAADLRLLAPFAASGLSAELAQQVGCELNSCGLCLCRRQYGPTMLGCLIGVHLTALRCFPFCGSR